MLLPTPRRKAARRAAFTLLEVLVVVAILVILAGVASISVFKYLDQAREGRAKADMQAIAKVYESWYATHSEWPTQEQAASMMSQGQDSMIDPWGKPYTVQIVPQQADGGEIERPVVFCQSRENLQFPQR